jgi:hypothetical protein
MVGDQQLQPTSNQPALHVASLVASSKVAESWPTTVSTIADPMGRTVVVVVTVNWPTLRQIAVAIAPPPFMLLYARHRFSPTNCAPSQGPTGELHMQPETT